mmetsp:Transcript_1686/g.2401  ORF Transcript_1686/g.2401 Transcript_1686/m.2401 type:complete len:391 (-) Transcript_1686:84-1256(-)
MYLPYWFCLSLYLIHSASAGPVENTCQQVGSASDFEVDGTLTGSALALSSSGSFALVGSPGSNEATGLATLFQSSGNKFTSIATIKGDKSDSGFGASVALSGAGSVIVVGAPYYEESKGSVTVYEYLSGALQPRGVKLVGEEENEYFGYAVATNSDGSIIAVGAPKDSAAGLIRVFTWNGTGYEQLGDDIKATKGAPSDGAGTSVSLSSDGNVVAFGIPYLNSGAGAVEVYEYKNNRFVIRGSTIEGDSDDLLGFSASISSDASVLVAGTPNRNSLSGGIIAFEYDGSKYEERGERIESDIDGAQLGSSIGLNFDGSVLVSGAPSYETDRGIVQLFSYEDSNYVSLGLNFTVADQVGTGSAVALSYDGSIVGFGVEGYKRVGTVLVYNCD